LRLIKDYDEFNTILLPPRSPSEKLPQELLDFYDEHLRKMEEIEKAKQEAEDTANAALKEQEKKSEIGLYLLKTSLTNNIH